MSDGFIVGENCYKQKIMMNPQDFVGKGIVSKGIYDKTGLYFIEKILAQLQGAVVFDVGANIGNHALRMGVYASMVYLFEPQVQIVKHLQMTMNLNNISNWKICNYGLSDVEETLPLYQSPDGMNCTNSFVSDLKHNNYVLETAQVFIGDKIVSDLALERLDFIKVDVEGFEAKVISGLQETIAKYRPVIFMEWDKVITKQQFEEGGFFDSVFANYLVKAVTRNPHELSLLKKIQGKIRRLFDKTASKKRMIIGEFQKQNDYRHVVFVPEEKKHILDSL